MKIEENWIKKFASDIYSYKLLEKINDLNHSYYNKVNIALVANAINFAKKHHGTQNRDSGEPFYSHPLEVAYITCDYCFKTDVLVAAILHDVVEDTVVTIDMVYDEFGCRVSEIVSRLTRNTPNGIKLSVKTILDNACVKKDNETLLIKIIDRIHNLQTIQSKPKEKRIKTFKETSRHFMRHVDNLGLIGLKQKLFALCVSSPVQHNVMVAQSKLAILGIVE